LSAGSLIGVVVERLRPRVSSFVDSVARRIPVNPNAITLTSLIVALVLVPLSLYWGPAYALAIALCGLLDVVDGAVARVRGVAGPGGAFLDSVVDRVVDAVLTLPLTWIAEPVVAYVTAVASLLISYVRARAEGLCVGMRGVGFLERGERMVALFLVSVLWLLVPSAARIAAIIYAAALVVAASHRAWLAYNLVKREGGCTQGVPGKGGG